MFFFRATLLIVQIRVFSMGIPNEFVRVVEASTDRVEASQRIAYWEAHNAAELVGLQCQALGNQMLHASERNFDLGALRLSDIRGSAHEVVRSRSMVSERPKNALFASVLLEGQAYFCQEGYRVLLGPGEVVLYSTEQPYLFGFSKNMRQILVDFDMYMPVRKNWPRLSQPLHAGQHKRLDSYDVASLRTVLTHFVQTPLQANACLVSDSVQALVGRALGCTSESRQTSFRVRFLRAQAYIGRHAQDPALGNSRVAAFMNMSMRTLERLFARYETTVTDTIWHQRLELARCALMAPFPRSCTISDVAINSGFATQAHLSALFRATYGYSPSQYRRRFFTTCNKLC